MGMLSVSSFLSLLFSEGITTAKKSGRESMQQCTENHSDFALWFFFIYAHIFVLWVRQMLFKSLEMDKFWTDGVWSCWGGKDEEVEGRGIVVGLEDWWKSFSEVEVGLTCFWRRKRIQEDDSRSQAISGILVSQLEASSEISLSSTTQTSSLNHQTQLQSTFAHFHH
jgi:hypothetical protein